MATNSLTQIDTNIKTMTSREIAELTGKTHAHVLRDIRTMIDQLKADPNLDWLCESTTYDDAQGKQREMYRLDKDTTITLVSGYDTVLRMRIVKRWQELESQSQFRIPQSFSEALQLAADQAKQIEVMAPKADYYDRLMGSHETHDGEYVAKLLRTSVQKLYKLLRERGILTKSNLPIQVYIDKDYMRIHQEPYERLGMTFVSSKVIFTQQGIQYIRGVVDQVFRQNQAMVSA